MSQSPRKSSEVSYQGVRFPSTAWTLVLKAAEHPAAESRQALATLCTAYYYPIYSYVRRACGNSEDARELTQEFFVRVLEKGYLRHANRDLGCFRAYITACLRHFLRNERDRRNALRRGGGRATLALDFLSAENRYTIEPRTELTPEILFERQWALEVLNRVLGRLRAEYEERGHAIQFDVLKRFLTGDQDHGAYNVVAVALKISEPTARVAVYRLRYRYADILKREIADTVADPNEVDTEIRFLLKALAAK